MSVLLGYVLWIVPAAAQVYILVLLTRGRLRSEYPLFFSYTIFAVVHSIFQFGILRAFGSYQLYFYTYWVAAVIGVGLGFVLIYEVFRSIFRPFDSLRELGTMLFKWTALVLLLVAIVSATASAQGAGSRVLLTILVLDRSVRVMQCGLVLFLFLFSGYVGLTSRSQIFGIALGFGVCAAVELMIVTVLAAVGPVGTSWLALLKGAAYLLSCAIWLYYLRRPEPERLPVDMRGRSVEWNYALSAAAHPSENFLPMIESAVDRVLQRRNGITQKFS